MWEKYKQANALGNYWQIISAMIEKVVEQRKIVIANVPMSVIEDKKYSHKITLAEARLIGMLAFKYTHSPFNNPHPHHIASDRAKLILVILVAAHEIEFAAAMLIRPLQQITEQDPAGG